MVNLIARGPERRAGFSPCNCSILCQDRSVLSPIESFLVDRDANSLRKYYCRNFITRFLNSSGEALFHPPLVVSFLLETRQPAKWNRNTDTITRLYTYISRSIWLLLSIYPAEAGKTALPAVYIDNRA